MWEERLRPESFRSVFKCSHLQSLCIHARACFRVTRVSKIHKCAVSIKSQVLLIFHQGYSWINAFNVLLVDQFHDLFRHKQSGHVGRDAGMMPAPQEAEEPAGQMIHRSASQQPRREAAQTHWSQRGRANLQDATLTNDKGSKEQRCRKTNSCWPLDGIQEARFHSNIPAVSAQCCSVCYSEETWLSSTDSFLE